MSLQLYPTSRTRLTSWTCRKSHIAIEYAYKYNDQDPEAHIFWVQASTNARIQEVYQSVAKQLLLTGFNGSQAGTLPLVCEWLSDETNGTWLLTVDDMDMFLCANSVEAWTGEERFTAIWEYLPRRSKGTIIITRRDSRVGRRLANRREVVAVRPLGEEDSKCH